MKKEIRTFKFVNGKDLRQGLTPRNNIKIGDEVTLISRGLPKGRVSKVEKMKGGSTWYDIKLNKGGKLTRRAWDFKSVYRDK
jgi:hypothetical protein